MSLSDLKKSLKRDPDTITQRIYRIGQWLYFLSSSWLLVYMKTAISLEYKAKSMSIQLADSISLPLTRITIKNDTHVKRTRLNRILLLMRENIMKGWLQGQSLTPATQGEHHAATDQTRDRKLAKLGVAPLPMRYLSFIRSHSLYLSSTLMVSIIERYTRNKNKQIMIKNMPVSMARIRSQIQAASARLRSSFFFFLILLSMKRWKVSTTASYINTNMNSPHKNFSMRVILANARIQNQPHSTRTHSLMMLALRDQCVPKRAQWLYSSSLICFHSLYSRSIVMVSATEQPAQKANTRINKRINASASTITTIITSGLLQGQSKLNRLDAVAANGHGFMRNYAARWQLRSFFIFLILLSMTSRAVCNTASYAKKMNIIHRISSIRLIIANYLTHIHQPIVEVN